MPQRTDALATQPPFAAPPQAVDPVAGPGADRAGDERGSSPHTDLLRRIERSAELAMHHDPITTHAAGGISLTPTRRPTAVLVGEEASGRSSRTTLCRWCRSCGDVRCLLDGGVGPEVTLEVLQRADRYEGAELALVGDGVLHHLPAFCG